MLGHFAFAIAVQNSAPEPIRFNCPVCTARHVEGAARDRREQFKLFHLIPLGTLHTTWVKCPACKVESLAEIPAAELTRYAPGEVNRFIRLRVSPPVILLLFVGAPCVIFPGVGLIFPIAALAMAPKHRGWPRRVALVEIGLGIVFAIAMAVIIAFFDKPAPKPTFAPIRQVTPTAPAKP